MRVYNVKFKSMIYIIVGIVGVILLIAFIASFFNTDTIVMNNDNFTYILKDCHENPYNYVDKDIKCIGYVYRRQDFKNNQFVVARDMLVSDDKSRIVGFLCEYENANNLENNEWIEISGVIKIGDYHGAMPIINIKKVEEITTLLDTFVFPPT